MELPGHLSECATTLVPCPASRCLHGSSLPPLVDPFASEDHEKNTDSQTSGVPQNQLEQHVQGCSFLNRDPDAMVKMGDWYWMGLNIEQNAEKSQLWYTRSLVSGSSGNGNAQTRLALCFLKDCSSPTDERIAKGVYLLRESMERGNEWGRALFAVCSEYGIGVRQESEERGGSERISSGFQVLQRLSRQMYEALKAL